MASYIKHGVKSLINHEVANTPLSGVPLVEILGNNRLLIENHYGLIEYGLCRICVKVRMGHIEITGKDLYLTRMSDQQIVICGTIYSVQLCYGGVKGA